MSASQGFCIPGKITNGDPYPLGPERVQLHLSEKVPSAFCHQGQETEAPQAGTRAFPNQESKLKASTAGSDSLPFQMEAWRLGLCRADLGQPRKASSTGPSAHMVSREGPRDLGLESKARKPRYLLNPDLQRCPNRTLLSKYPADNTPSLTSTRPPSLLQTQTWPGLEAQAEKQVKKEGVSKSCRNTSESLRTPDSDTFTGAS